MNVDTTVIVVTNFIIWLVWHSSDCIGILHLLRNCSPFENKNCPTVSSLGLSGSAASSHTVVMLNLPYPAWEKGLIWSKIQNPNVSKAVFVHWSKVNNWPLSFVCSEHTVWCQHYYKQTNKQPKCRLFILKQANNTHTVNSDKLPKKNALLAIDIIIAVLITIIFIINSSSYFHLEKETHLVAIKSCLPGHRVEGVVQKLVSYRCQTFELRIKIGFYIDVNIFIIEDTLHKIKNS